MPDLKRLRFAQNSWIDVERIGGVIVDGTAPEWNHSASIAWGSVLIGQPVQVTVWRTERGPTHVVFTRPLESMAVLD